jgi:triosephosphate isomerase (TIM)
VARRPLIAGNWKMHKNHFEAVQLTQKTAWALTSDDTEAVEVVVCPPFTALRSVGTLIDGDRLAIRLGAQNCHPEPQGAYTGEVSAPMLAKLACAYVIVGHSERRQYFGETDETVGKRVHAALEAGLFVIACIGETEEERERNETEDVLRRQLSVLAPDDNLVLAYEPVWAIGTGKTATPEMAHEAHDFIKSQLDVPVLYGGSVKPENAAELLSRSSIDGALVGGASLDLESFTAICRAAIRS